MNIKVSHIINNPTFKDAKVLAGKKGLNRKISRVSVFDCAIPPDLLEQNIIEEGDFFISGLLQFTNDHDSLKLFLEVLCNLKCSGLCVMTNNYDDFLTEELLDYCDKKNFPVIALDENIPYAYVMDTINKFLSIENLNAINELKIDKILNTKLSEKGKVDILYSINSNIEDYIQTIYIRGDARSTIFSDEVSIEYLNTATDIFINSKRKQILIASNNDKNKLKNHVDAIVAKIDGYFENPTIGLSRIHELSMIDRSLNEANLALTAAKSMGYGIKEYNPLSSTQLLISLKDNNELEEFYSAYLDKLRKIASGESLDDTIKTMEVYVLNKGDFKKTGEILNQHENTIRYRINKVRDALGLEDDIIAFHEIISIITKISLLLKSKKM